MIIHIYVYELILCHNSHLGPPARYYLYYFTLLKYKIKQMTFHLNMFSKALERKVEIRSSSYITHLPLCNIESVSHVCKLFVFFPITIYK